MIRQNDVSQCICRVFDDDGLLFVLAETTNTISSLPDSQVFAAVHVYEYLTALKHLRRLYAL